MLAFILLLDVLFDRDLGHRWVTVLLIVLCVAGGVLSLLFGRRVPSWVGLMGVLLFTASHAFYLGLDERPLAVISSVLQLPIAAFYLGWFVRPRLAVPLIALCLLVSGVAMYGNPLFLPDGRIGAPVAVHALLSLIFCFIAGSYLWRRQAKAANTDPLTEVYSRHAILERVRVRLRKISTRWDPSCVVLIDFDDFKQLNNELGHAAGDAALFSTASSWQQVIRSGDSIGRIGGDEFLLLLPHTSTADARGIVERLRACSEYPWSAGIAETRADDTVGLLLARADRMLYADKQLRRQVRHA